jgi:lysophospholipase L1-like esterase
MKNFEKIEVLGDSILKGIQVNPNNQRYYIKNDIDTTMLSSMYNLKITNESRFGCTVIKGSEIIIKKLEKGLDCDALVMDFGGNDCDFKWADIASNPNGSFKPNIPLELFETEYINLIKSIKNKNIIPILTTLPPLEPQRFFDWWCRNLNKENVLKWLGSVGQIYKHQEIYSSCVKKIAKSENVLLVDIRAAFLKNENIGNLICVDGTHPNSKGQQIITNAFQDFINERFLLAN